MIRCTKSMGGVAARPLDSWIGLRDAVPIKPVGTNALPPCDTDRSRKTVWSGRGVDF